MIKKIIVFMVAILFTSQVLGLGELTNKQEYNVKFLNDQMSNVLEREPGKFLYSIQLFKAEVIKLNKEAFGLKSDTIDKAAAKIEQIAVAVTNSIKMAQALTKSADLKALNTRLNELNDQLSTVKSSLAKNFKTEKREQAKNYELKVIEVLEILIDDAIASVSLS